MSPERLSSSSDGTSLVLEQPNEIAPTIPNDSSHVQQPSSSSLHSINNQQPSMNVAHHYHHSLQHQQHPQLQQNNVSITTVNSEISNGHHSGLTTILTSTYNSLVANDSYSTVVTLSGQPTASTTTTMATNTTVTGSKLLVLHPNQLNDSFKSSKYFII